MKRFQGEFIWGAILSCGLALVLYASSLSFEFTYDDRGILLQNENVKHSEWSQLLLGSYWGEQGDGLFRPLTMLSYGVNFAISGKARSFHGFNIALHIINVLLLYLIAYRYWGVERAVWSSVLFAANPILSESVASIVGRAELLSFTFGLTGWILWDYARGNKGRVGWLFAASVALLFSQLAKENGMIFSFAMVVAEWKGDKVARFSLLFPITACMGGIFLKYFAIGSLSPSVIGFIDNPLAYAETAVRMTNGLGILVRYGIKLVFPWPMSVDYSFDQIPVITPWYASDHMWALALLLSVYFFARRWAVSDIFHLRWSISLALSIFLVCSIPIASSTIYAERLLYLPVAVFTLLLCGVISQIEIRSARALFVGLAVVLSGLTLSRIPVWENDTTLFSSAVLTSPRSARSFYGLGVTLHRKGQLEPALAAYDKALEIYPKYAEAQYNRAALFLGQGEYAQAHTAYSEVVAWNPGYIKARRALALIEIELGHIEQGLERLRLLASENKDLEDIEILVNVLGQLGRRAEAEQVLLERVETEPNNRVLNDLLKVVRNGGN